VLLRRLRLPMVGIVVVFVYGTTGYMVLGFDVVDGLYMTALALTTAGFTPAGDLDEAAKGFTISIAVFGVTLFLVLLAIVTSAITEGRIGTRARRRRMERKVEGMRDHYIVCAYGRMGRSAVEELASEGARYVVIDSQEELEDDLREDGVPYLIGNPASEEVLRHAGIEHAKGLICAMDDDAANVYVTVIARSLNPDIIIVARAAAPETPEVLERAGADRVISPYATSGGHMGRLALRPGIVDYLEISAPGATHLRLDEVQINEGSPLVGAELGKACGDALPLLLRRTSGEMIPNPPLDTQIRPGDTLLVFGDPDKLRSVEGV
jgi:voltage-gated potassium channel